MARLLVLLLPHTMALQLIAPAAPALPLARPLRATATRHPDPRLMLNLGNLDIGNFGNLVGGIGAGEKKDEPAPPAPAPAEPAAKPTRPQNVGEAKAAFASAYGRRVNPLVQGFINELISSVQIATVGRSFMYTRVFALGFSALCETFMENAISAEERRLVQDALCAGLGLDAAKMTADAAAMRELAEKEETTEEALLASADFVEITAAQNFKYSYPFGAGLLTLMPCVGVTPSADAIERWCARLEISDRRLKKDFEFYEAAINKMAEARQMMMEMQAAAKRKEAASLKEAAEKAAKEAASAEAGDATGAS